MQNTILLPHKHYYRRSACFLSFSVRRPRTSVLGMNGALARRMVDCLQYRRACGNVRLWSGGDNQVPNARVRRSQRFTFGCACLVRCEQPRNPLPLGMGRVNHRERRRKPLGSIRRGGMRCCTATGRSRSPTFGWLQILSPRSSSSPTTATNRRRSAATWTSSVPIECWTRFSPADSVAPKRRASCPTSPSMVG
jgi:hypothetical protein